MIPEIKIWNYHFEIRLTLLKHLMIIYIFFSI